MKQKKMMLLGGIRYLLPAIEAAHKHGMHVITVDYLPENIAHKYSDEYHNISIIDKDAVLNLAKELQIDGILSFAVDPGVISAAYTAEQMGLPFQCSYESTCILQDKAKFRHFLTIHGFNVPKAKGYPNPSEALNDINYFNWPVIVKPVDSAGSKGVSRVDNPDYLEEAINYALSESHCGQFIIEDFLEKEGLSSGSESFVVDGKLKYNGFYDQYFDNDAANPYTPSAECWPSQKEEKYLQEVRHELQRLIDLLHIKTGLFNVEWRVCKNGKVYLMEVSPRAGGNRLAEMLNYAADIDIIEAEVCKAVGYPIPDIHEPNYNGFYAILVLHNKKSGIYQGIHIDSSFKEKHVIEEEIRVNIGDRIESFTGANQAIGTLFLKFSTQEELELHMENYQEYIQIMVK